MTEKFCLKWNNFQSNVTLAFSQLRTITYYQDVTLVSDDNQQMSAHRVLLSSCSKFFYNIFSQNTHSHPLLCLDGINSSELKNFLDYIYDGELQIYSKDLERFLHIANKFQLEGLQNSDEYELEESARFEIKEFEEISNTTTCLSKSERIGTQLKDSFTLYSEDFQSVEELDAYIKSQTLKTEKGTECSFCGKFFNKFGSAHVKEHIETHINGLKFECIFCGNTLSSRHSARDHKRKFHKEM